MRSGAQSLYTAAAFTLAWGMAAWGTAGTYRFDLAQHLDLEGVSRINAPINLATEFQQIDNAWIELSGTFAAGTSVSMSMPFDPTTATYYDDARLFVRLGDASGWILSETIFWEDLSGTSGELDFHVPLLAPTPDSTNVLFPWPNGPTDYSFLLDGEFHIVAGLFYVNGLTQLIVDEPTFAWERLELVVEGRPVPEPGGWLAMLAGVGMAGAARLRRRYLQTEGRDLQTSVHGTLTL